MIERGSYEKRDEIFHIFDHPVDPHLNPILRNILCFQDDNNREQLDIRDMHHCNCFGILDLWDDICSITDIFLIYYRDDPYLIRG